MAELFLSRTVGPEGFEKLVVLKKILPSHAENPKFVRLFLDEAKLAATLEHPHIAHVYDMGKVDGHYFFTMEYVHGQDVRSTIRRTARLAQKFPIDHAVQITRNVAAALHYAHERTRADGSLLDIVHRDVSPSNVLVSYDGAVKLVDFGVAKAATSTVKTRTGTLKGKISYMSPEQAKGAPVDRRSDIFSLGIMLWEMVTLQRLYKAENDLATIQMIINSKAQPPSQLRRECPSELDRIILRALATNPDDRYQTAEQLQLDLEELAREQKLNQSTVSLRTYMHELFADEIRAWSTAQASGQTLTEHMIEKATEMTTPVSESEIYAFDDFDDEDDEEHPSETIAPPTMITAAPIHPMHEPALQQAGPASQHVAPIHVPPQQRDIAADQAPTLQMLPPEPERGSPTPFPIAPREWRPAQGETISIDIAEEQRKRILIGSSIAFGAIVVLLAAFAARNPRRVVAETAPDRIEMKSGPTIEMTPVETTPPVTPVEQPAAEQPPAEQPPAAPQPAEQPAAEAPVQPEVVEPKPKRRRSSTKPTESKPESKSIESKSIESKPKPKPAVKPETKPATKPYDPNSPLAPP
jgi:serine/threonine protein kinase